MCGIKKQVALKIEFDFYPHALITRKNRLKNTLIKARFPEFRASPGL